MEYKDHKRLFMVRRTLMVMLRDRGYTVKDSDIHMTESEFLEKFKFNEEFNVSDHLDFKTCKRDNPSDQIYVFFQNVKNLNDKVMRPLVMKIKSEKVLRAIVVTQQTTAVRLKEYIGQIEEFYVEVFKHNELMVNVTEHALVPKHQVLTDEEKKKLLETYAINEYQLPRIRVFDPVARYYGAKVGQIIMITRPSHDSTISDENRVFRFVI